MISVPNSGPITKSVFAFLDETFVFYVSVSAIFCDGPAIENKLELTRRADAQPLAGSAYPGPERILVLPRGEAECKSLQNFGPDRWLRRQRVAASGDILVGRHGKKGLSESSTGPNSDLFPQLAGIGIALR